MNRWLVSASIVSAIAFLVHLVVGGAQFHQPALARLEPVDGAILSAVWHAVSLVLALNALFFLRAARPGAAAHALQPTLTALAFAVTFLGYGLVRLGSLTATPQWTIFLAIAVLGILGWRRA